MGYTCIAAVVNSMGLVGAIFGYALGGAVLKLSVDFERIGTGEYM